MLSDVLPVEDAIAGRYGKRVERPFLDAHVRKLAASMPVTEKMLGGERKAPLRLAARSIGAELIASREKKAAQYGSGFMKVLKAGARKEKLTVEEYLASLAPGAT
jgi:asparagine synthase (glutamine-hydrolysing)